MRRKLLLAPYLNAYCTAAEAINITYVPHINTQIINNINKYYNI